MAEDIARDLAVHGRVQGVFFRAFVRDAATRHGVAGWADNRPDGTVGVRLEGGPHAVATVERACAKGSEGARVDRVDGRDVPVERLTGFAVR